MNIQETPKPNNYSKREDNNQKTATTNTNKQFTR